jgi:dienelactone hydrolase
LGSAWSQPLPRLDGRLNDAFWNGVAERALVPAETGVPPDLGGGVRAGVCGSYLCLAARLPEPGGKILARSIGRNPIWQLDATLSPPVEDRIEFRFESLTLTVNPWGAYRIEEKPDAAVLVAAEVAPQGWIVEAALPLELLGTSNRFRAHRIRARRALAPEFHWTCQDTIQGNAAAGAPAFDPPRLGNTDPPLEVGRVSQVPSVTAEWDAPGAAFELPRNEPYPRLPRYPTSVRWAHDGRTLALYFRSEEPEPVVARAGGRDSNVIADDHVAVYLATSGSAALEIAVNTVGAIRDAIIGGPRVMRPNASWNASLEVHTDIRHGVWTARLNIPLDQCARALGETGVPREWRVVLARYRAPRPGEADESSALPPIGTATFYGSIRYRRLILAEAQPAPVADRSPQPDFDSRVWSPLYRRYHAVRTMVQRWQRKRAEQAILAERKAWETVRTREDWERFRAERLQALRESTGVFPPERPPLDVRITARHTGRGYKLENVVYQSRPGFCVTANLYLPDPPATRLPGMIIVHSQHYPKTQGELHDMGELWARTGGAVLIMERPGYGERAETNTWYRQAYASRYTFTKQLYLVGESYSGWVAWDIIRAVDFFYERPEIDRDKILLLGSVAGGGEPAAVAAALDPRISAVVPFNYDQGHIRVHGDSPGQIARQFHPWLVAASVAPRRFVRAFEFGWEGAEEPDYPELWVDGLARSHRVWDFYGARDNLAVAQAYGLIRLSMERASHCFSIGPQQRLELYPVFERWFQIPRPSPEDLAILPDSELSVSPDREAARRQEAERRRPHTDLVSLPPAAATRLPRRKLHQIAYEMGVKQLEAARASRRSLRDELKRKLGDIDPAPSPRAEVVWTRARVEALSLESESGIAIPFLLLRPSGPGPFPVVVAVAQGGKERFVSNRFSVLEALLRGGIAVCLPDVRGTGETSPASGRSNDGGPHHSLAQLEFDLGNSILGARLKDLRTVLAYLRTRADLDRRRMALWGESFAPDNPRDLFLDELEFEGGPQIQYRAEPLGAHLALLAALYENDIRGVAARGGLAGYLTVLEDAFPYVPIDVIVHGLLQAGDIADFAAALAPRPLLLEGLVNGRNVRLDGSDLTRILRLAVDAYRGGRLVLRQEPSDISAWLTSIF